MDIFYLLCNTSAFAVWTDLNENFSIGIVSPYTAQVVTIQEKLGQKYENEDGFHVNVKSIGGFRVVSRILLSYPLKEQTAVPR